MFRDALPRKVFYDRSATHRLLQPPVEDYADMLVPRGIGIDFAFMGAVLFRRTFIDRTLLVLVIVLSVILEKVWNTHAVFSHNLSVLKDYVQCAEDNCQ